MVLPSSSSWTMWVGRDALDGVEQGAGHLLGEGGNVGQGGLVFPLERWLGAGARQPAHVVCFRRDDVPQGVVDGAVGAGAAAASCSSVSFWQAARPAHWPSCCTG